MGNDNKVVTPKVELANLSIPEKITYYCEQLGTKTADAIIDDVEPIKSAIFDYIGDNKKSSICDDVDEIRRKAFRALSATMRKYPNDGYGDALVVTLLLDYCITYPVTTEGQRIRRSIIHTELEYKLKDRKVK